MYKLIFYFLYFFLKIGRFLTLLSFFATVFSTVNSKHVLDKILPMTGYEKRTCGIGSNRSDH